MHSLYAGLSDKITVTYIKTSLRKHAYAEIAGRVFFKKFSFWVLTYYTLGYKIESQGTHNTATEVYSMKWEVIQMDERCANGYYVNLIRKAGEEIPEGWHLVGQAKTKAEAKEIYNANGGCFI